MSFSIILILLYCRDWKNWNDFIYLRKNRLHSSVVEHPAVREGRGFFLIIILCLLSSVVEQLTRNEQVEGSTPLGGSLDIGRCKLRIVDCGISIPGNRIRESEFRNPQSEFLFNPKSEIRNSF
jgi:hypothetical protein